ncbi:MAG: hypothetical protein BroJett040_22300 [Oligoflexia bacterium]|nr:MAG: hypothetical protein BroJett040_22300 [Oligoflexia bacterium]
MIHIIKRNWFNIILSIIILAMLVQRLPSWIEAWKLQGQKAPNFQAETLDGTQVNIPETLPKPGALIFWATWCGPCTLELSRIKTMIENKELDPSLIRAISIGEDPDLVKKTVTDRKYNFPVLIDTRETSAKLYKVFATPTIIIFNEKGEIDWVGTGISPTLSIRLKKLGKKE